MLPYELPLLAAAAAPPAPHAFDFQAGAFRFHETSRGRQFTLVAEVPIAALAIQRRQEGQDGTSLAVDVMALVKDAAGTVVERLSNTYPLEGPLADLPALQRGNVVFKRQLWLGAGRYTLTTVVRDQQAGKISVRAAAAAGVPRGARHRRQHGGRGEAHRQGRRRRRRGRGSVPQRADAHRAEPGDADLEGRQQPDLGLRRPLSRQGDGRRAEPDDRVRPGVDDRRALDAGARRSPTPTAGSRCVATFPAEGFAPGTYELRAIARQGDSQDETRTTFTIVQ